VANIVVVGSINTDMVVGVPRLPAPGETVLGGAFRQVAGGKGANQAVAAVRAGADVAMVGCVGDEQLGHDAVGRLRADGVVVSNVHRVAGSASGVALIVVDATGQNSIAVAPGANMQLTRAHVCQAEALFASAGAVLVQLEVPLDTVSAVAAMAARYQCPLILDPAPAQPLPQALWRQLAVITPNTAEAERLAGRSIRQPEDAWLAADGLLEHGVEAVIITLGAAGVVVATRQTRTTIAGHPVQVSDTTGAGDTFAGALATRLAEGVDLVEAARFGNAAAALSVTRPGAQPSVPTRDEVTQMLALA